MQATVVGGGLAGAATALWLQHHGVETRVLERRSRPGTTLCGEGLSARTLRLLCPAFDAAPFVDRTFVGARWRFPGTEVRVHRRCHTLAREDWIPAMLEAFQDRGGTVEYGHAVRDVDDLDGVVVGADGPGSRVREAVPGARVKLRTGIQVRLETDAETDRLEFVTSKRFGREYAWWFPRSGAHNVGLLAEQDGDDWARLDAFRAWLGLEGRVRAREAYPIAYGGTRFASQDGRVLLVGDAAGLTNPVTKGGIAAVVHAARLLSECVARGRVGDYDRQLRRHPLTHGSYQRALRRLRRWSDDDLRRLLAPAPPVLDVGGPTTDPRPLALRTLARRPWAAPALADFHAATARSIDWSW